VVVELHGTSSLHRDRLAMVGSPSSAPS